MKDLFTDKKYLAMALNYLSDLTMVTWLYFRATNYNDFGHLASQSINSPDFQIQLYKVFIQSLTFFLLIFFIAQTFIYVLAIRKFRPAFLYLKFFSVFGFAVFLMITIMSSSFGLMPMIIYLFGYYVFSKVFKETAVLPQTTPQ